MFMEVAKYSYSPDEVLRTKNTWLSLKRHQCLVTSLRLGELCFYSYVTVNSPVTMSPTK